MSKEHDIMEDAAKKEALFSLVEGYKNAEPVLMVRHFNLMLACEAINILKKDNAALVEELKTLRAIVKQHQSQPVQP